ncbi:MAG: cyclic nucleotide-binding domain-containing protein [Desulfarculaceae bacterium]|nr:cyclic nucleotide-binding domain-containing protein [Desulfarculaceae bacterium]MCF8047334.1 cyclic nucleotide-binding domain-containing protein [Desulfarculaceae bacterium]MCF8096561.1 cyclic nucleotide-binding domain-containing protein [Desulfarculaceae bacterium]MCF8122117.1 cyclic nucleotide-binding domain-containing protein [Desulfarculaceae bacterium]
MIEAYESDPRLERYLILFHQGQTLFLEGEESQDLFVLVEGELDVLKGDQVITILSEPGAVFGEMSFLMGDKRTATIRARIQGKALCVPRQDIGRFLQEFPELGKNMAQVLAQRLDAASNQLFGLKEFCDMLPDAVVLTDQTGKVTALNRAASELYGRDWRQAGHRPMEELFEQGQQIRELAGAVRGGQTCHEQVVSYRHPQQGSRYVSVSLSGLYDAQQDFKGLLLVARDVTGVERLKNNMHRLRGWLIAAVIALVLCVGALGAYPYLAGQSKSESQLHAQFSDQLTRDQQLLSSLLAEDLAKGNMERSQEVVRRFFSTPSKSALPYTGVVVLDTGKKVLESYYPYRMAEVQKPGSSYGHIAFEGDSRAEHRVLTVFHQGRDQGGSWREILVAFPMSFKDKRLGWLLIGLDPQALQKRYDLDKAELAKLNLDPPRP